MKEQVPFNAGEFKIAEGKKVMICGHIWWPVEQRNAYHCMIVDDYGEPKDTPPQYIWDNGGFSNFTPKEKVA